jgi:nitric oxide reductase
MVEPLFTKEHIDGLRPHIQQTVDSLLDAMIREGGEKPVDIVEKFALPVASYVSCSACDHSVTGILIPGRVLSCQTIYGILGVPFKDLAYLTQQAAIRSNGSATATQASNANALVVTLFFEFSCQILISYQRSS